MTLAFRTYAQFDRIWERLQPETPYGRAAKEALPLQTDPAALAAIWDDTEAALGFLAELEGDAVRLSRLQHHLKRLPRCREGAQAAYDEVEIFQFKKFLHNYRSLLQLLPGATRHRFQLDYASEALEQLLDQGRQSAESFYVADAYSPDLAEVRQTLRETEAALRDLDVRRTAEIQARWGFAFGERAFLLVPRTALGPVAAASDLLRVEPFDATRVAIRPQPSAEAFLLQERRTELLALERRAEDAVLERLSRVICAELERFAAYRGAITRFDLALARATLAREGGLVRPRLGPGAIEMSAGRFLPCEDTCQALGTRYVPLDACFGPTATVLFGSNMGGKTIVLKTLAFLQLCTQMGLFVPAAAFTTRLFSHCHYLGEGLASETERGLSGFGFEIRSLVTAARDFAEPTLVLFDEFARTTNSVEAEALLSAVLQELAARPGVVALFSTHFRGVRRLPGVGYLRMKGLNREALPLGCRVEGASAPTLEARIRHIDQLMDYRLVPDDGGPGPADALAVARLLGLDAAIADRAADFIDQAHRMPEE